MADEPRPYSRSDYNRALIGNALLDPFAILLLTVLAIAGMLLSSVGVLLPVGLLLYGAAAARAYFDEDVANKVLERERDKRRMVAKMGQKRVARRLAPPIAGLFNGAVQRELRIREAIEGAQLPYTEVLDEVDRFVTVMEGTASRAQLLYEALEETPVAGVQARLLELRRENDPAREELTTALIHQAEVLHRMERQLQAFYDQMEKILVELDTVRGNLVSVSASTDAAGQQQLAAEVRGLREEVGALADGMSEAYEGPAPPA